MDAGTSFQRPWNVFVGNNKRYVGSGKGGGSGGFFSKKIFVNNISLNFRLRYSRSCVPILRLADARISGRAFCIQFSAALAIVRNRCGDFSAQLFGKFSFSFYLCPVITSPMSIEATTISRQIAEYFKTQPVVKAWLFGSYARGEQREDSDVDILVVLDHSQPVGLRFFGMYEDLKELLGRNVDLVVERTLAAFARESVNRDKILIYERAA